MERRIINFNPKCFDVVSSDTAASDAEQISRLRSSQSPIAISVERCSIKSTLKPLQFKKYWDNESSATLLNNGQTGNRQKRPMAYKSSISLETLYPNSSLKLTTPSFSADPKDKFSGYIPIEKLDKKYSASSGPGGQNVNKVHTKVDLRFKLSDADWISPEVRNKLLELHGKKLTKDFDSSSRPRLNGGPLVGEYVFEQMHFHWSVDDFTGCEHVLNGRGYAAECHLVHYNSKYKSLEAAVAHPDGLAVVGFLLEATEASNPGFDKFVQGLEVIKRKEQSVQLPAESLDWMNDEDILSGNYITYKGSLTTPPFTECVTWILYEKPVRIGEEQLGLLRQLEGSDSAPIDRNVRPTQKHPPGHSVIYVKQKSKL